MAAPDESATVPFTEPRVCCGKPFTELKATANRTRAYLAKILKDDRFIFSSELVFLIRCSILQKAVLGRHGLKIESSLNCWRAG
jgi:hypothetical protein